MRTRARLLLAMAIVLAMVNTSACSKFFGVAHDPDEIVLWTGNYSDNNVGMREALAEFTAGTGIEVQYTTYSTDALKQVLSTTMNTSAAPDVFQMWSGMGLIGPHLEADGVAPLDSYAQQFGWADRFVPAARALHEFDGRFMGVPFNVHGMSILYREDLFATAGIEKPPATYDELVAANEKLVAAGITPMSLAGKYSWDTMRLFDSLLETTCGAAGFDALRALEADWTRTPCAEAGFAELRRWVEAGWLPQDFMGLDPGADQMYTSMFSGQAAMTIAVDSSTEDLLEAGQDLDDWGLFPFPTDTGRLAYFAEGLWVSQSSTKKDNAARLLDFLTSPAVQQKYFGRLNTLVSPTRGVTPTGDLDALTREAIDIIGRYDEVFLPSDQAFPAEVVDSFFRNQDSTVLGTTDPREAVAALQRDIDTYREGQQP